MRIASRRTLMPRSLVSSPWTLYLLTKSMQHWEPVGELLLPPIGERITPPVRKIIYATLLCFKKRIGWWNFLDDPRNVVMTFSHAERIFPGDGALPAIIVRWNKRRLGAYDQELAVLRAT
jgi:hypothetical protein